MANNNFARQLEGTLKRRQSLRTWASFYYLLKLEVEDQNSPPRLILAEFLNERSRYHGIRQQHFLHLLDSTARRPRVNDISTSFVEDAEAICSQPGAFAIHLLSGQTIFLQANNAATKREWISMIRNCTNFILATCTRIAVKSALASQTLPRPYEDKPHYDLDDAKKEQEDIFEDTNLSSGRVPNVHQLIDCLTNHAAVIWHKNGTIVSVNTLFERLLPTKAVNVIGQSISVLADKRYALFQSSIQVSLRKLSDDFFMATFQKRRE